MLRVKRQRSEALRSKDRCTGRLGGGRRWRAESGSGRGVAGDRRDGVVARGSWPVGKKPVIRLLGLNGGGGGGEFFAGLLEGNVDSEKAGGERDVVFGRHGSRFVVGGCCVGVVCRGTEGIIVVVVGEVDGPLRADRSDRHLICVSSKVCRFGVVE
jgi:hypothetical protein